MPNYVITISRQFGSMGRTIAEKMSKFLDIEYLDRDIVELAAQRMGHSVKTISDAEESAGTVLLRARLPFNLGVYSITDEIFEVEKNIILDAAKSKPCIIVGRCADSILRDFENRLNIYVYAPYEARLYNCTHELMMDEKTARRMIKEVDAARANYQKRYCPEVTSVFDNKDIMIDSSRFGIEETAGILAEIVKNKWG